MKKTWIFKIFALTVCLAAIACDKSEEEDISARLEQINMSLWLDDMVSQCGMCEPEKVSEYLCEKKWVLDTYALYEANTDWKNLVEYLVYRGEVLAAGARVFRVQFNTDGTRPLWVGTSPFPGASKNPDPVEATWQYDVETGWISVNTVYETGEKSETQFYLRSLNPSTMILEHEPIPSDPFDRRMLFFCEK